VREDSIAVFPLIPGFGFYYIFHSLRLDQVPLKDLSSRFRALDRETRQQISATVVAAILLLMICLVASLLRFAFIGRFIPLDPFGWFTLLKLTLFPMGLPSPLLADAWLHDFWAFTLGLAALSTVVFLNSQARWLAFVWVCSTVIATAPGVVFQRINLLMFPILFLNLYLALIINRVVRLSNWAKAGTFIIVCILVISTSTRNMLAQEAVNPSSLEYVSKAHEILQDPEASVPPERAARLWTDWSRW